MLKIFDIGTIFNFYRGYHVIIAIISKQRQTMTNIKCPIALFSFTGKKQGNILG